VVVVSSAPRTGGDETAADFSTPRIEKQFAALRCKLLWEEYKDKEYRDWARHQDVVLVILS
jgi:hypothetical protein